MTINKINSFNRRYAKTAAVYLGAAAFCLLFDNIYALFGHGVRSASMTYMFAYPLLCGTFVFGALALLFPRSDRPGLFRLAFNAYNSGAATLTVASALKGVFDIAGTASDNIVIFFITGWLLLGIGAALFIMSNLLYKQET